MMKRTYIVLLLLCTALLSSCKPGLRPIMYSNDKNITNDRVEHVLEAVVNKDTDALKKVFSKKALSEIIDFDDMAEHLFDFFEGNIESWERDGFSSDGKIEYGKRYYLYRYGYNNTTDIDKYVFFFMDYVIDTFDKDNEGLYMLEVNKKNYRMKYDSWQERMKAGIYIYQKEK